MSYKKCEDWYAEESIVASCPYCGTSDRYYGLQTEGDTVKCSNKKCKKTFKLGPEM